MDPELSKQLQQMLAALLANAQDAAKWAKAEIPLLVQEKIAFGRAWETALLLVFLGGMLFTAKKIVPWSRRHSAESEGFSWLLTVLPFVVCIVGSLVQLHDVLLVWFAPRLYIVEWLVEMVRPAVVK